MSKELNLLTFDRAERVGVSRNGNPTWRVYFKNVGGSFLTSVDSSVGYDVPNWRRGDTLTVQLTKAERISVAYKVIVRNGRAERAE